MATASKENILAKVGHLYVPKQHDEKPTRHRKVLEKHIEENLCIKVKMQNGIAYKFVSPMRRSVPDRLLVMPYGWIYFVECKRPGEIPTMPQAEEMLKLTRRDHTVFWIDSFSAVETIIDTYKLATELVL